MSAYVWKCPADKFLRRFYPTHGAVFVAEWLGIDPAQVRNYAQKRGIKTTVARGRPFASGDDARRHDLTPINDARRLSATVAHPIAHRL